jgi:glycosyltransferase involved in cell wall biosynthesis
MPKFSIIAVDYEFHVPRPGMQAGLQSIADQTFKDFELIIIHDGPKEVSYEQEFDLSKFPSPPIILNTPERMNDWGHSSRDYGMQRANGDYFIQFNIDNKFEPDAFEKINNEIELTSSSIVIFAVRHYKAAGGAVFSGLPPLNCHIDAMQLVAHKNVWENVGYWYNKHGTADGIIYEDMCKRYPYTHIPECLGDNY